MRLWVDEGWVLFGVWFRFFSGGCEAMLRFECVGVVGAWR